MELGQGSSNSKKAKTWRVQNFSDSWPGQKQNCKIVYFLLVCYIICCSVNKKTLLRACYHLAIDIRSISNKNPASSLVASVGNRDQWKNNGKLIAMGRFTGGLVGVNYHL